MSKKVQIIISFIMLFCCVCAIIYNINFKREVNEIKSDDAFLNMQDDIDVENTDIYDEFLKNFDTQGEKYYYSFIELVGYDYPILLLSNGVYGDEVALWTDIYYWFLSLIPISCIFNFIQGTIGGFWWTLTPIPQMGNSYFAYMLCWLIYIVFCVIIDIILILKKH